MFFVTLVCIWERRDASSLPSGSPPASLSYSENNSSPSFFSSALNTNSHLISLLGYELGSFYKVQSGVEAIRLYCHWLVQEIPQRDLHVDLVNEG